MSASATDLVGVRMRSAHAREWAFRGGTRGECMHDGMYADACPSAGGRVGFIARTAASGQEGAYKCTLGGRRGPHAQSVLK